MAEKLIKKPEEMLPLSPPILHIMVALRGGKLHGYGIMKQIEADTEGQVNLGTTTLYRNIRNMLEEGLIEETNPPIGEENSDERRVYYQLTGLGNRVIKLEIDRLNKLVQLAQQHPSFGISWALFRR